MPVITLEAGKLNKEQKSQLVKEFAATASKVMNVPEQAVIVEQLKAHGMTSISETGDLTLDISQKILERAL